MPYLTVGFNNDNKTTVTVIYQTLAEAYREISTCDIMTFGPLSYVNNELQVDVRDTVSTKKTKLVTTTKKKPGRPKGYSPKKAKEAAARANNTTTA